MEISLDKQLVLWLDNHASMLDSDLSKADDLLQQLASYGLFKAALPVTEGGLGEPFSAAIAITAKLAEHSLTAAFVYWAQRIFIECLVQSPNHSLARHLIPLLLEGKIAGATGLSNAMKSLSGFDQIQAQFYSDQGKHIVNGFFPWVTNLSKNGFVAAFSAGEKKNKTASIFAVPHDASGLVRGADLELMALRASNTAPLQLSNTVLNEDWIIHPQADVFLPRIRPALIGLQCGWALGIARAGLTAASHAMDLSGSILKMDFQILDRALFNYWTQLAHGIDEGSFIEQPRQLLEIRVGLFELASTAVQLELQARGGKAYLPASSSAFIRRWHEMAFLPIVTPSLLQLKTQFIRSGIDH